MAFVNWFYAGPDATAVGGRPRAHVVEEWQAMLEEAGISGSSKLGDGHTDEIFRAWQRGNSAEQLLEISLRHHAARLAERAAGFAARHRKAEWRRLGART